MKGERPELVVQKLTELGVDRIVPFVTARSVVRWDDERGRRATPSGCGASPARRPCSAAAAGCRWSTPSAPFAVVAAGAGAVLADDGGGPVSLDRPVVLVGPEGGWAPEELARTAHVGLGPHVLRAETAAIAAGALLVAKRAGRV